MKYLATCVLLFLLFPAFGESSTSLPSNCGKTRFNDTIIEEEEDRIINGTSARLGQFPWSVRLATKRKTGGFHFHCGGSLISSTFVVSAAHCEEFGNIARVGQTYGTQDVECDEFGICAPPFQDITIKKYILEDYCRKTHRNDLMLIELERPAVFNDFVQPICLPPASFPVSKLVGKKVVVSGWGRINGTDPKSGSKNLLYIVVPVLDPKQCALKFTNFDSKQQICLAKFQGKIICKGDSGSGVVTFMETENERRAFLIGIVSYGARGCTFHSVQTSVPYYLNNILAHIDKVRDDL